MQLLQLLDFDLLLPQKVGIPIVLDGEVLLLAGRGQRFRDVLGILEGLTVEKIRIRSWLLAVLGEESCDKVFLAKLICMHSRRMSGKRKNERGEEEEEEEEEEMAFLLVLGPHRRPS